MERYKMKVLELFAGTRSIGRSFEESGHEVYSIDYDEIHNDIDWYVDLEFVTADDILERFGKPDIIWASPDCTTYSIAAISHHRRKIDDDRLPISEYAKKSDRVNKNVLKLIEELKPKYYFIENPRGAMRKMKFMQELNRYTVTYCQYGDVRMKPTDIWTNHPDPTFRDMCKNGMDCHVSAPRGSRTGTQGIKSVIDRSRIPKELYDDIVLMSEDKEIKLKSYKHVSQKEKLDETK